MIWRHNFLVYYDRKPGNKVLELNPSYLACSGRADVYFNLHQYQKSLDDYTSAIYLYDDNAHPDSTAHSFYSRGRVHKVNGDYLKAWVDFSVAHFLAPENIRYIREQKKSEREALRDEALNRHMGGGAEMRRRAFLIFNNGGQKLRAIHLWEDRLTDRGFIDDFEHTLYEISRSYKEKDTLSRAEPFFIISILYSKQFVPENIFVISRLYRRYSKFLSELGRDSDSRKMLRNSEANTKTQ